MSQNKHTPGPWSWGKDRCGLYGSGPDNEVLRYERYEGMWLHYCESKNANANLIAAAPDLLQALDDLLRDAEDPMDKATTEYFRKQARAAMAKARGEQP